MMDIFSNLALGFEVAFTPMNLLYCMLGVTVGTMVGVLPGLGPAPTITMLLPLTFSMSPEAALIMLAGLYYGAQYGGSTSAVLLKLPGEPTSIVTCLDGHAMAKKGRAGAALGLCAIASFIAGTIGTMVVAFVSPPLTRFALSFGPYEYFSLMALALVASVVFSSGSLLKAVAMVILGMLLGCIGTDMTSGVQRLTFGTLHLQDGLSFAVIAMGLYGFGEILSNLQARDDRNVMDTKITRIMPTRNELKEATPPALRGTALGALFGVLPGTGAILASFMSYALERRLTRKPKEFGNGAIAGLAGPEAANNAAAQTAFIPLLTLGLPGSAVSALIIGALTMQGITPGPQVMSDKPGLFWGLIASFWIGNLLLLIINLPLVRIWVLMLKVPYRMLYLAILAFACIGIYTINFSILDVVVAAFFGFAGFAFRRMECDLTPLLLGLILGPMIEDNLRRAMLLARGDWTVFLYRPLSVAMLLATLALLAITLLPRVSSKRALLEES